jgi:hypothetical protein
MKKIVVTLIIATLLTATTAAPVLAHGRDVVFDPFWPITAALTIPAAIVDTALHLAVPVPVVYSGPAYYSPAPYYAPRVYVAPRGYYSPRVYYPPRGYRVYRYGW